MFLPALNGNGGDIADCNGDENGSAFFDQCGVCVGGNTDCTGVEIDAQDCSHGRDVTNNGDPGGHAGFSFTKLDSNGVPLANQNVDYSTTPWVCVKDNVTGLT